MKVFNLCCWLTLQEELTEKLRESMKKSRQESELNTIDSQVKGLETRLKFSKGDREKTVSKLLTSFVETNKLCILNGSLVNFFFLSAQAN